MNPYCYDLNWEIREAVAPREPVWVDGPNGQLESGHWKIAEPER